MVIYMTIKLIDLYNRAFDSETIHYSTNFIFNTFIELSRLGLINADMVNIYNIKKDYVNEIECVIDHLIEIRSGIKPSDNRDEYMSLSIVYSMAIDMLDEIVRKITSI